MPVGKRHRQGFTLIEMLIVASLIALFAGLAMFGAQVMFDSNRKKAMWDESKSIGVALSFARQDLGFYPRIHLLGLPLHMVRFPPPPPPPAPPPKYYCLPAMDTYGYYGAGVTGSTKINPLYAINNNWRAPYMTVSQARANNSSGRRSGVIKMRLSDNDYTSFPPAIMGEDPSLVDWPTDTWGNPYCFYQVSSDSQLAMAYASQNPKGLRLITKPTDDGDFFVAVVSYGPNGVPGGNDQQPGFGPDTMLYVKGDLSGKNQADFTLKSIDSQFPAALLDNGNPTWVNQFAQSIESRLVNPGQIGITDSGSDDVFYKF